ncbi:UNVERIFIED_CONTAM: hypothetical protein Q9R58_28080 [Methylobacteriaceae bacterium AG10]|nr:hypothetical protein [Methylobacteriaceae bacterium AG10]
MRLTAKRVLTEARKLLDAGQADLAAAAALYEQADRLQARAQRRIAIVQRVAREHDGAPPLA